MKKSKKECWLLKSGLGGDFIKTKEGSPFMERGCAKCGKIFLPAVYHRFRDKYGFYCSWACYNHRNDDRTTTRKVYKRVIQYDLNGRPLTSFSSASAAAEYTGFGAQYIQRACRKHEPYNGYLWAYEEEQKAVAE